MAWTVHALARIPRSAWLCVVALGAAGIAAACSSDTQNNDLVTLTYINTTPADTLRVRVKIGNSTLGTYNLKAAGAPDTWTAIGANLKTGVIVNSTVLDPAGNTLAVGICTVSDAPTLGFARILITPPDVNCDCGFAEHGGAACGP